MRWGGWDSVAEHDADRSITESVLLVTCDQACRKSCPHGRRCFEASKLPRVSAESRISNDPSSSGYTLS